VVCFFWFLGGGGGGLGGAGTDRHKTLITHAPPAPSRFSATRSPSSIHEQRLNRGLGRSTVKSRLQVRRDVITAKCAPYRPRANPGSRPPLLDLDDYDIVPDHTHPIRGIVNYYLRAPIIVWRLLTDAALERRDIDA